MEYHSGSMDDDFGLLSKRHEKPSWKKLLCYPAVLAAVPAFAFFTVAFVIHAQWHFYFGMLFNFVAAFFAAYVFVKGIMHWRSGSKVGIICIVLQLAAGAIFVLAFMHAKELLFVRSLEPDPTYKLDTLPTCHGNGVPEFKNGTQYPILNCSILKSRNMTENTRVGCMTPPVFHSPLKDVVQYYRNKAKGPEMCSIIQDSSHWFHARCLTHFMGYADDLVVHAMCNDAGQTEVHFYSQARLGVDDAFVNEARVRRLVKERAYPYDPAQKLPHGACK